MKKHTLKAEKRTLTGRKVKKLRAEGKIPATVYGKHLESESITLSADGFTKVYAEAGETGLIELTVGSTVHPVLINVVQIDPIERNPIHVEFHKVDLKEKVHANIPLELIGISPAVEGKLGTLLTLTDEIAVEALPTALPEKIEVDVSALAAIDDEVTVASIHVPADVTIETPADTAIVRVAALVTKAAEEEAAQAAAEAAEAKVEAAGSAPAAGEQTPAAAKEEAKQEEAK